ncbi:HIT family protein [Mycoplasma sp. CSL10137]|uniref:histidine triad protein HinT n=1 Tax=unclassified Mycoplasma TaxID=2683645 RepID=UPI00197BE043|nr:MULTISPECIES: HIT family protein [unclassified Mycoplasma]MBN4083589.1 HIT family protein [Mycoplasma sp. CSL10137]MBU4692595.1 HIT family protein [Mycoplasma sp. CSL7491-lung]
MASIFTKIINREINSNIIYEDDKVISILDVNPKQPGHFLVIPKIEKENLLEQSEEEVNYLMKIARQLATEKIKNNEATGFKIVINTGKSAGQEVMHTHVHVVPYK